MKYTDLPPLDVEEAIDLILALPSHRSSNPNQAKFGMSLATNYLFKLKDDFKGDDRAFRYLTDLIPLIASAVRAFSVERDTFGTRWESIKKQVKASEELSTEILKFSPFRKGNIWGKVIPIILGTGSSPAIDQYFIKWFDFPATSPGWLATIGTFLPALILGVAASFLLIHLVVLILYNVQIQITYKTIPNRVAREWRGSLKQYRKIVRFFIINALRIRQKYYPDLSIDFLGKKFSDFNIPHIAVGFEQGEGKIDELNELIEDVLNKHFVYE